MSISEKIATLRNKLETGETDSIVLDTANVEAPDEESLGFEIYFASRWDA